MWKFFVLAIPFSNIYSYVLTTILFSDEVMCVCVCVCVCVRASACVCVCVRACACVGACSGLAHTSAQYVGFLRIGQRLLTAVFQ